MAQEPWTLARITSKVQDDLELHAEDLVTYADLVQFVNDAIDDAEETVIDCFSDFLLTKSPVIALAGQTTLDLPANMYESRIRGFYYAQNGFGTTDSPIGDAYKLRQIDLNRVSDVASNDPYQYRLTNSSDFGQKMEIFPPIRAQDNSPTLPTSKFLYWFIRSFNRLSKPDDLLEKGLRIQYILSHMKCACMRKEGDPMLEAEQANLINQEAKLKSSLSRLTDDDEGVLIEPNDYSLEEAYPGFELY